MAMNWAEFYWISLGLLDNAGGRCCFSHDPAEIFRQAMHR